MSEEYDLVKVLNDPDVYYPGNFVTAEKAAAFLMCLCQEAADKIRKLEVAESFCDSNCTWLDHHPDCKQLRSPAPESEEPVAYIYKGFGVQSVNFITDDLRPHIRGAEISLLYLHPPKPARKPMTEEEINRELPFECSGIYFDGFKAGVRFAEQYHGIVEQKSAVQSAESD